MLETTAAAIAPNDGTNVISSVTLKISVTTQKNGIVRGNPRLLKYCTWTVSIPKRHTPGSRTNTWIGTPLNAGPYNIGMTNASGTAAAQATTIMNAACRVTRQLMTPLKSCAAAARGNKTVDITFGIKTRRVANWVDIA